MEKLLLNEQNVISEYKKIKNIHKVAELFKVSISPIKRILKNNGIDLTNRRYSVNDKFFDNIDSEVKAYWLGFLFADGYIRERKSGNSLEMKLSLKDKDHLKKFRTHVESNHQIKESKTKVKYKNGVSESSMCHLAIYSSSIVQSIKKHGIHSKKTFTIQFPNIQKNLISHFIRGYFDGDGSFSFNPKKYKTHTNIVCASDLFRKQVLNILNENKIGASDYGRFTIHIQDKIGNLDFYNYIYNNATLYLKRKKEKYEEFRRYYKYDN